MMEAVARGKASWLFCAGSQDVFLGKRRPQEDMVTSAVFGSIRLMSPQDRRLAIEVTLGADCFKSVGFSEIDDIEIRLWHSFVGTKGRNRVEPDVLLICGGKTVIVEVKWHASLSRQQLEHQIEAARLASYNVVAVVLLGEAGLVSAPIGVDCFQRTWRDVSGEVQEAISVGTTSISFQTWLWVMHDFLNRTDMGRIFNGLMRIAYNPGPVRFQFVRGVPKV